MKLVEGANMEEPTKLREKEGDGPTLDSARRVSQLSEMQVSLDVDEGKDVVLQQLISDQVNHMLYYIGIGLKYEMPHRM